MLSSLSLTPSSSSVSATVRVDKATSELLVGPDWSLNIDICDLCNSNHWLAKDVVKEVKRRLQHKNPKVQLLSLTLLETMVKNCGEYIHYHISERKILDEMIKLVKKKADMHVREKILVLLDSWQEAFGGPNGKYSQYFWACDELRRYGVHFPQRSTLSAPVITPPVSHPSRVSQIDFGMPANSSQRLDEAMSSEVESLSTSKLESMRNTLELLDDMLQAVDPNDRMSVKEEVIVDLADHCRSNQKKLMQMITTTTDEELLIQGLEMNDLLQGVLTRHDGIASGAPLPNLTKNVSIQQTETPDANAKSGATDSSTPAKNGIGKVPASDPPVSKAPNEEEEEEDEFALLARRHSKTQSASSQCAATGSTEDGASSSGSNNALVLFDAPSPATTMTTNNTKEQDIIDLLSIVLTTNPTPSETSPAVDSASAQNTFETSFNSYVVPWAQPQPQQMTQSTPQPLQPQYQPMQAQMPTQSTQGYVQQSTAYPPPPWEATSGYGINQIPSYNSYLYSTSQRPMNNSMSMQGAWPSQNVYSQYRNQPVHSTQSASNSSSLQGNRTLQQSNSFHNPPSANDDLNSTPQAITNSSSSLPINMGRTLQQVNSFPARMDNGIAINGSTTVLNNGSAGIPSSGQKSYIPSYRLFEDLNVLSGSEAKLKSGPYPSASGTRM
ncbi:unnamed protein product [Amaranthus hypochondriacus]